MSKKEKKDKKTKITNKENKKRLKELERQAKANENNFEMVRLFKILLGVIGALLVFGLVFAYFHGDLFKKKAEIKEEIQNVEILAGTAFTKQSGEYYVLFYEFDGESGKLMDKVYAAFERHDRSMKVFKVDLGNSLNKAYKANSVEEINTLNNKDLKVLDPTLIKFNDGSVVNVYSGKTAIVDFEESVIKTES